MALRDQPYLPLYVQDFLTDEKLRECSYEAEFVVDEATGEVVQEG